MNVYVEDQNGKLVVGVYEPQTPQTVEHYKTAWRCDIRHILFVINELRINYIIRITSICRLSQAIHKPVPKA